jgi:hypothetical protein
MRYDFDFSNMPAYVLVKTGEFAVVEDFYKLLRNLAASPRWVKGAGLIIDHQYLDLKKMTFADVKMIQSIVEFNSKKLGAGKCAFIIKGNSDALSAGLSRLSDSDLSSPIKFFATLPPAKEWISP